MAKVTGPLHSDAAHGALAGQLTYKQTRHGATVEGYSHPGSKKAFTPSAAQLAVRTATRSLMQAWKNLPANQQATWNVLATARNLSPANVYLQENYKRQNAGLDPTNVWPPNDDAPDGVKIYSGATTTPTSQNWPVEFADGGHLTQQGNEVWTTGDLSAFYTSSEETLDGQFSFADLPSLGLVSIGSNTALPAPTFNNVPSLGSVLCNTTQFTGQFDFTAATGLVEIALASCGLTAPPILTGLSNLYNLDLSGNALTEVDSILVAIRNAAQEGYAGIINLSGGTNAAPTATGQAAIAWLTSQEQGWTVTTN